PTDGPDRHREGDGAVHGCLRIDTVRRRPFDPRAIGHGADGKIQTAVAGDRATPEGPITFADGPMTESALERRLRLRPHEDAPGGQTRRWRRDHEQVGPSEDQRARKRHDGDARCAEMGGGRAPRSSRLRHLRRHDGSADRSKAAGTGTVASTEAITVRPDTWL